MADTVTQIDDDNAEKAYAAAASTKGDKPEAKVSAGDKPVEAKLVAAKTAVEPQAKIASPQPAVEAAKAAPVQKQAVASKPVATKPVVKKAVARKPAKIKAVAKPATPAPAIKKAAAKPAPAAKSAAQRKTPARRPVAARTAKLKSLPQSTPIKILKEKIMATTTTTKKTADEFTAGVQVALKDAQGRAKTAFDKSQALFGNAGEFTKGNLEAMVESGKILAGGFQSMGKSYVAEAKSTFETLQGDIKEIASVKSPTDLLKFQSSLMRKYFDNAVAYNSKNAEAALKLANDAFQPLSNRVSLAVEKARKAA